MKTSNINEQQGERPPTIAEHFRAIDSVLEFYTDAVASLNDVLWELDDHVSDILFNRLSEHLEKLEESLWTLENGIASLRKNFYIDPVRKLPSNRIDYVYSDVDEELK